MKDNARANPPWGFPATNVKNMRGTIAGMITSPDI